MIVPSIVNTLSPSSSLAFLSLPISFTFILSERLSLFRSFSIPPLLPRCDLSSLVCLKMCLISDHWLTKMLQHHKRMRKEKKKRIKKVNIFKANHWASVVWKNLKHSFTSSIGWTTQDNSNHVESEREKTKNRMVQNKIAKVEKTKEAEKKERKKEGEIEIEKIEAQMFTWSKKTKIASNKKKKRERERERKIKKYS